MITEIYTKEQLLSFYYDFCKNYYTVGSFAEENNMTIERATEVLDQGRELHLRSVRNKSIK